MPALWVEAQTGFEAVNSGATASMTAVQWLLSFTAAPMDATNKSLSSPLNTDLRLAFHDMIHDLTREKPLTEPLLP